MAMQAVRNRLAPCYELSAIDDNNVIDVTNKNSSEVIDVIAYPYLLLSFKILNDTHYRWCGPALLLIEYFAKFTNTR